MWNRRLGTKDSSFWCQSNVFCRRFTASKPFHLVSALPLRPRGSTSVHTMTENSDRSRPGCSGVLERVARSPERSEPLLLVVGPGAPFVASCSLAEDMSDIGGDIVGVVLCILVSPLTRWISHPWNVAFGPRVLVTRCVQVFVYLNDLEEEDGAVAQESKTRGDSFVRTRSLKSF